MASDFHLSVYFYYLEGMSVLVFWNPDVTTVESEFDKKPCPGGLDTIVKCKLSNLAKPTFPR
jgi:hypothetical protein